MSKAESGASPLFWWCSNCEGPVTRRSEECFCCSHPRPENAELLTREETAIKARQREQMEEALL